MPSSVIIYVGFSTQQKDKPSYWESGNPQENTKKIWQALDDGKLEIWTPEGFGGL